MCLKNMEIEYLEEVLSEIFVADTESLLSEVNKNLSILEKEFLSVIDNLCKKCCEEQNLGKKNDIKILHFCYLQSARLTRNYKLQVALYDQNFYLDQNEISTGWDIQFIMKYFEQEMEVYEKRARQKFKDYQYSQIQKARQKYFMLYFQLVGDVLQMFIPLIEKSAYFNKMRKKESFYISYGEYMLQGFDMTIKK